MDTPREKCGVVAVSNITDASYYTYLSIYALQHRGQESAGIVSSFECNLYRFASMGKVNSIFTEENLKKLPGNIAIGHNRYSTTGESLDKNIQPINISTRFGEIAIAHNGNLVNYYSLRRKLELEGSIFLTNVDTEIIIHLIAKSHHDVFLDALMEALRIVQGAYSLAILKDDTLYIARDPNGFRPLVIGEKKNGWVFASETCALDIIEAKYIRQVKHGELIEIKDGKLSSYFPFIKTGSKCCAFELIYFSRPDSQVFEKSVYQIRYNLGKMLAKEHPVKADIVIAVPDSSNVSAIGYSEYSKIPFHIGLIRSHYIGRTFIEPSQKIRDFGAKLKYNTIESAVKGKSVVVIDDSIVRGTTQKKIISMLKKAGAKKIHVRIASPPIKFPCYYGIDMPSKSELIANNKNIEEIRKYIGVDSLQYMSEECLKKAIQDNKNHCFACFDGKYSLPFESNTQPLENQSLLF